jgi:hypothetical protein
MPKESYVAFFLISVAILASLQLFVYSELRRYIRFYFTEKAGKLLPRFRWLFILMNIPIVVIYFRRQLAADLPTVTNIILYPYTIWVFLLVFWTLILIPIVVVRILRTNVFKHG